MTAPDYPLCNRTVTVYRKQGQEVSRQVVENCYFSRVSQRSYDAVGMRMESPFLLVMPGTVQRVFPGDRIFDGVGPKVEQIQWERFLPSLVPELVEAAYATPCYWDGELCHVEAGRK